MGEPRAAGTADHVGSTMRIALLGVAAAVQPVLSLPTVLAQDRPVVWAAYLALTLVTAVCGVWVVRRRPVPPAVAAGGAVVALAASWAATSAVPPEGLFGPPHWSFGLVGWHLLLLLLDRVPVLLTAFAVNLAVEVTWFALRGAPSRAEIGAAGVVVLGNTIFQLAVVVLTRVLRRSARQATEVAAEHDRVATRVALAEQWEQDQRTGFAGQLGVTLPLLAELADGVADPREDATRERCALATTQLRRLFAENDDVPDPLVHEIGACVDVAERRGVAVALAVSGTAVELTADVRRELTGPVVAALSAARSRARVSVLRTEREVRVAVVADAEPALIPASPLVEVECGAYGRHVRMEAKWRSS